jgi:hypothetical protein
VPQLLEHALHLSLQRFLVHVDKKPHKGQVMRKGQSCEKKPQSSTA